MSQYKVLAAYAAGLIAQKDRFVVCEYPCWGLDKFGGAAWNEVSAHVITILGALKFAQIRLSPSAKAYNLINRVIYRAASQLYNKRPIELSHNEALYIMLGIAMGEL